MNNRKTLLNDLPNINRYTLNEVGAINSTLPIIDEKSTELPILNQNLISDCTIENVIKMMQRYWLDKTGEVINFSGRYLVIKLAQAGLFTISGTQPIFPMEFACTIGCCTTDLLPDDTTLSYDQYINVKITLGMDAEAAKYKMGDFKIFSDIRTALTNCKICGVTLPEGDFSKIVAQPTENIVGYHRLSVYGDISVKSDEDVLFINSWGDEAPNGDFQAFKLSDFNGKIYDIMGFVEKPITNVQSNVMDYTNKKIGAWIMAAQWFEGWWPGSSSWDNDNLGNLKFVGQALATNIGPDDGSAFCTFQRYGNGWKTIFEMFWNAAAGKSKTYTSDMTIGEFYKIYTDDGPASSANYAATVARFCNCTVDTPISWFLEK